MGSIIKYFTWCISDINLCLTPGYYFTESSRYAIGEDSQGTFYLNFSFDGNKMSVNLCRTYDGGPTLIKVRFSLTLQTVDRYTFDTKKGSYSFLIGDKKGFSIPMTKNDLVARLPNDHEKDNLIVICQTVLLKPSFAFSSEDIRTLSADLLKLRSEGSSTNAELIVGVERSRESIPVHKEILSARSPIFEQKFRTGDCYVDEIFPAVVLKAMVDFLYSGDISKIDLSSLDPEQLYACAVHYKIPDLIKLLTPERTFITSIVDRRNEVHTIQFENFTTLCRTLYSVEHRRIKMQYNEDVVMTVKVLFEYYNESGNIILETKLWNLSDVRSVFVRLFIRDSSGERRFIDKRDSLPENGISSIKFSLPSEQLFSARNSVFPKDVLSLDYELQFRLTGEFRISDPEIPKESDFGILNREVSSSLITSMESLRKSEHFADALLVIPSVKSSVPTSVVAKVHKSILSARSTVFKDMFRKSQNISVDFPASVVNYLLHYVYTGVLIPYRPGILDLLHKAAVKYRINSLTRACEVFVAKITLDTKNMFPIYSIAARAELSELKESCKDFAARNSDIIFGSFRWERLRQRNKEAFEEIKMHITTKSLFL